VPETELCLRTARSYTDSTLVGIDTELEALAVTGTQGVFRCAVSVRNGQLDGSVAGLGSRPLPIAP
jgi:hypothetical protein